MAFERREILLIVGVLFVMVGAMAFLAPIIAVAIAVLTYFGMKAFAKWRKRKIKQDIGEGICAVCGARIVQNKCPNCDVAQVD